MIDRTGTPATSFELRDAAGNLHRHQEYLGRWQLLVFHRHLG